MLALSIKNLKKTYASGLTALNNISLDDLSFIDIESFLKLYTTSWNVLEEVQKNIISGKEKYKITNQLMLPPLIIHSSNIENFVLPENRPNYITRKAVTASVVNNLNNTHMMKNSIVFIPSADPGFDWIFTHDIAGFVTAYGGVNSHMAIRAGEMGLPAIIGSGEKLYHEWKSSSKIHIDCANQRIEVFP